MRSSVALLSLFVSNMKPTGIKLLESAAAERDPSDWPPHAPGLGAAAALLASSTPSASGTATLGASSVPASSAGLSTSQAVPGGASGSVAPTSNGAAAAASSAPNTTSLLGPTTSGSSSSSHMSFGVVLGRLMPLLDDEISHGHSEDDERSIAGDSWSVKSEYGSTLDGDDGMRAYELTVGGLTIAEGSSPPRGSSSMGGEHETGEDSEGGASERGRGHALAGPAGQGHSSEGGEGHSPGLPAFVGGSASGFPGPAGFRGAASALGYQVTGSSSRSSSVDGTSGRLGGVRESLEEEEEEEEEDAESSVPGGGATTQEAQGFEVNGTGASSSANSVDEPREAGVVDAVGSGQGRAEGRSEPGGVGGGGADKVGGSSAEGLESNSPVQGKAGEAESTAEVQGGTGSGDAEDEGEEEAEQEQEEGEDEEEEEEASVLGLRSHWESTYAEELATFYETGEKGDVWFGRAVMDAMAEWTAELAAREAIKAPAFVSQGGGSARDLAAEPSGPPKGEGDAKSGNEEEGSNSRRGVGGGPSTGAAGERGTCAVEMRQPLAVFSGRTTCGPAASWKVLDIGTGNGLLLHALAKHGFQDLTGTDYCEDAVRLAHAVAARAHEEAESRSKGQQRRAGEADSAPGSSNSTTSSLVLVVDDILRSTLEGPFQLIVDKGTLDAVNLHPDDAATNRELYKSSVARLLAPGGLLVITSCNRTKDELIEMITRPLEKGADGLPESATATAQHGSGGEQGMGEGGEANGDSSTVGTGDGGGQSGSVFEVVDFMRSYPKFRFGGAEGTTVCTVAFRRIVL